MPLGTAIHNIQITLGKGGQLARAMGAVAKLIANEGKSATLKLPFGEVRLISKNCLAIVRQVGNVGVNQKSLDRAGSKRWLDKSPVVRGVVMNPVDHPHGGGKGRAPIAANANYNMGSNKTNLVIIKAEVNEGTTVEKLKPRARGRSFPIKRSTCHITIRWNSKPTINYNPKRTRFRKQHRGRMKGISSRGNHIYFGKYALQALEPAWITSRQIEAGRRAMTRNARRKIWVRIFPDKPVILRPAETRMSSGKGSPEYWVAVVKPRRILYEMGGVTENIARRAISLAASKMPIQTQFIIS
ncbi:hypothetical protein H5410_064058 [Solanum commersonii]|uniref:Large ribosomal subunit protein uL2 C-terminal domain-containing protein n=1 Tax=Solanum commersonii TaxID=4109 RepID=A0A9J5W0Q3_SOLCO|nr:hypothetical protein H5410_064058 [Solanum commersonii]